MSFSTEPVISLENISIHQQGIPILDQINFQLEKGEFIYLLGRTGSGKSSLLKTLYADLATSEGKIQVAGFDLNTIKNDQVPFLRRKIGIIFQDFELFKDRSVYDNLFFVLKATGWTSNAKIKQRISDVLMRVGLEAASGKIPYQLSGGEQQRIVIARALLNEPVILLADEPTGNLDPETSEQIMELFEKINLSGTAILMATHNHSFIQKYPKRYILCNESKVLDSKKEHLDLSKYFQVRLF